LLDKYERRDLRGASHKKNFSCLWVQFLGRDRVTYHVSRCDKRGRYQHNPAAAIRSGESTRLISTAWDHLAAHPTDLLAGGLLRSAIITFILDLLAHTSPVAHPNAQAQIIASVVEYIHAHLGDELSLPSLSRLAGYSPFFFHRLFVRHTGQTPVSYINAARLVLAKELLLKNQTVEAVAEAVGFSSISYFNHFFKKRTGFAPRTWTKSHIS
jgi:AraC-like DNA-binding protein